MPIYEYKCDDCGEVSEVLVRNTANQGPVVCGSCASDKVNKLFSAPAAVMSKESGGMPPISCPKASQCGASGGSCPAAAGRM